MGRIRFTERTPNPTGPTRLDRLIAWLSPERAYNRIIARLAYDAAATSSIRRRYRTSLGGSADSHATPSDLFRLINISRDLERNDPMVTGQYTTMADNIVGTRLSVQSRAGARSRGGRDEWKSFRDEVEAAFREWAENPNACDASGQRDLHSLVWFAVLHIVRAGDCAFLKVNDQGGKLYGVEADQIVTPGDSRSDGSVNYGIQADQYGKPLRYYISPDHSTYGYDYGNSGEWYPANYVIHPAFKRRFSQTRGAPILVASFNKISDIAEAFEHYLLSTKLAASVGLIFIQQNALTRAQARSTATTDDAGDARREEKMHPAMIFHGEPGEEVKEMKLDRPQPSFAEFFKQVWKQAGRPSGMAGELIMLDFSESNFSNTRQAIIESRHGFTMLRNNVVIPQLLRRIYRWKVGYWTRPGGPLGLRFGKLPPDWLAHEWQFAGWDWVDPLKDINADGIASDRSFTSIREICSRRGVDLAENLRDKAEALKLAKQLAAEYELDDYHELLPNVLAAKQRSGGRPNKAEGG